MTVNGVWRQAMLLTRVRDELGALPLVAEDLGIITPEGKCARHTRYLHRVLQFAFGGDTETHTCRTITPDPCRLHRHS